MEKLFSRWEYPGRVFVFLLCTTNKREGESDMRCEECNQTGTTTSVRFYSVIGMLIVSRTFAVSKQMCKGCAAEKFTEYTLTSLLLGWWGVLSFIATPFVVVHNLAAYAVSLVSFYMTSKQVSEMESMPAMTVPAQ